MNKTHFGARLQVAIFLVIVVATPCACAEEKLSTPGLAEVRQAISLEEQGQPENALSVLDAAINSNGSSGVLFLTRGAIRQRVQRDAEAIDDFTRAIELEFRPSLAYTMRSLSRLTTGDRGNAIADVDLALKSDPNLDVAYVTRGVMRLEDKQFSLARQDFDNAIRLDPSHDNFNYRAICQLKIGNHAAAIADATRAAELDPTDPDVLYIRMSAHLELGDEQAAAADHQLAEQLEASNTR